MSSPAYKAGQARPSGGAFGLPPLAVRNDAGGDLAGTDQYFGELTTDSHSNLRTTEAGGVPTYTGVAVALAPASSATDVYTVTGSATATIEVDEIRVSGVATAAIIVNAQLVRRSAANTGGTSATITQASHNSGNAAGTATIRSYTANPTLGASAGVVRAGKLNVAKADASAGVATELVFDLRPRNGSQPVRLSGIAEVLALNLNGETVGAGGSLNVTAIYKSRPTTA